MTSCEFAVFPDGSRRPAAVFVDLEDALAWGLDRYGGNRFTIRRFSSLLVARPPAPMTTEAA